MAHEHSRRIVIGIDSRASNRQGIRGYHICKRAVLFAIYKYIMSTEETALRFLRAAVAAQFHKNGSFEPLLWNAAIVVMRISTGGLRRSRGRCKVLDNFVQNPCTGTKLQALAFKACSFVQYALE